MPAVKIKETCDVPEWEDPKPNEDVPNWRLYLTIQDAEEMTCVVSLYGANPLETVGALAKWKWSDFDPEAWNDGEHYLFPRERDVIVVTDIEKEE